MPGREPRTTEQGNSLVRDFITAALQHDTPSPTRSTTCSTTTPSRGATTVRGDGLRPIIMAVLDVATPQDWAAVERLLVAEARAALSSDFEAPVPAARRP